MKRRVITLVLVGLLIFTVIPLIERAGASYDFTRSAGSTSPPLTISGASDPPPGNVTGAPRKESLSPAQKKISSDLVRQKTQATTSGRFTLMAKTAKTEEDRAYVYVSLIPSASTLIIDPYVLTVTDRDEQNHVAAAWVNVNDLEELASLPEVRQIQTVTPPQVTTGSVIAQSDAILRTSLVRSIYGYDGTGIRVGIISDGVDHLANAQATGDLPANVHVLSNIPGGDEGTAMLEIVHDMAPGAELYFHDHGSNTIAFNSAIDELRAAGCTVICDDIGWPSEPYFEDGIIATHIRDLLASQNFIYVSSAGNDANIGGGSSRGHYQGTFSDAGSNWHDFSSGTSSNKYLYVTIPAGGQVRIILQWNDQFGQSANDYDLYLYEYPSFNEVSTSENVQSGSQNPYESISYKNEGGSAKDYAIAVNKISGNPKILEIYIYGYGSSSVSSVNTHPEDSIYGHKAVPDVITVGAIRASDPGNDDIEPFSSQGPVTISYPSSQSRQKPDLAGIDGVSVTGAGGFPNPFYGTSAAAPTVAAAAAVIWSGVPGKSAQDIRNRLYSTAIDLGAPGRDTVYGYGRVDAMNASFSAGSITSINPSFGYRNSTVAYTISGSCFQPGNTTVEFRNPVNGALLNTTDLTSVTTTRINGTIVIPCDAPTGPWNLKVIVTDFGEISRPAAFTVASMPAPQITAIDPISGYRNASINYSITGNYFQPGKTVVEFRNPVNGALLNTTNLTSVTTTRINGTIMIPYDAPAGSWNISVITFDGGRVWKPGAFIVNKVPAPALTSITPASGNKNTTVPFTIAGTNFQMTNPPKTKVRIYEDVADTELATTTTGITPTQITGTVNVTNAAFSGSYILEVSTVDGGVVSKASAFAVSVPAIPAITSITPVAGYRNSTVGYSITGTNFQANNNTFVVFRNQTTGEILNTTELYSVTSTRIIGNISIPTNAPTGLYRLDITTLDGGVVNRVNAFRVDAVPAPTITSITPTAGYRNSTVGYSITGTNFQPGKTVVMFRNQTPGFTGVLLNITELYSVTSTRIIGNISIPWNAPKGSYRLEVATIDGGNVTRPNAFTANVVPAPAITSITPVSGSKNSIVAFTIVGNNFQTDGRTTVTILDDTSGTRMAATLYSVTSATVIGSVTIPGNVPAGLYRLEVTTVDGGAVNKLQAFTVNYLPLPVITSITPTIGSRSSTVPFTLNGNNFEPNFTVVRLRLPGQTLNATLINVTTTKIPGTFTIPPDALTGTYRLDVITAHGGFNNKYDAFSVA